MHVHCHSCLVHLICLSMHVTSHSHYYYHFVCYVTDEKDIRSEIDARAGSPQVYIRQVILYHEVQCNYDESRLERSDDSEKSETKTTDTRLVLFGKNGTGPLQPHDIENLKKSISKSQMSLSSFEINVEFYSLIALVLTNIS